MVIFIGEGIVADPGYACGNGNAGQIDHLAERIVPDYLQVIRQFHFCQTRTTLERAISDCGKAVRQNKLFQTAAQTKCIIAEGGQIFRPGDIAKSHAICKCTVSNGCNAVRHHQFNQVPAVRECIGTNGCHAVRQYQFGQIAPVFKGMITNGQNRIRKHQFLRPESTKGIAADMGNAPGHDHFSHRGSIVRPGSSLIFVILHSSGAGNGQLAVTGQHPGQVLSAGASVNFRQGQFIAFPGQIAAVVLHSIRHPGSVVCRVTDHRIQIPEHIASEAGHSAGEGDLRQAAVGEGILIDIVNAIGNLNFCQTAAAVEGMVINSVNGIMHHHTGQAGAAIEQVGAELMDVFRNDHAPDTGAALKCATAKLFKLLGQCDFCQTAATVESTVSNHAQCLRQIDCCQTVAIIECLGTDISQRIRDFHICQTGAVIEGLLPNFGDSVGQIHTQQFLIFPEGACTDGCHRIGNFHLPQIGQQRKSIVADGCDTIFHNNLADAAHIVQPGHIEPVAVGIHLNLVVVRHGTGAGNGQNTIGGHGPGEIFAAGACVKLGDRLFVGFPGQITAVVQPVRLVPGGIVAGVMDRCGYGIEGRRIKGFDYGTGNGDIRQRRIFKCLITNVIQRFRECDFLQRHTAAEGIAFNAIQILRKRNFLQIDAVRKGTAGDIHQGIRKHNLFDIKANIVPGGITSSECVHIALAGDGQGTANQFPSQIFTTGSGRILLRPGCNPGNIAAVVLHDIFGPGGIACRVIAGGGQSAEGIAFKDRYRTPEHHRIHGQIIFTFENCAAQFRQALGEFHALQIAAVVEYSGPDFRDAFGNPDIHQSGAGGKQIAVQDFRRVPADIGQSRTAVKRALIDVFQIGHWGHNDCLQTDAGVKGPVADKGQRGRQLHIFQLLAVGKAAAAQKFHTLGQFHAGNSGIAECIALRMRQCSGQYDFRSIDKIRKGGIGQLCNAFPDHNFRHLILVIRPGIGQGFQSIVILRHCHFSGAGERQSTIRGNFPGDILAVGPADCFSRFGRNGGFRQNTGKHHQCQNQ